MQLIDIIIFKGKIRVKTGLHIGAGNENVEIGGIDLPVIKNPVNQQPYIPGSSLKGKMRFLTEWQTAGALEPNGDVHSCKQESCKICRMFGPGKSEDAIGTRGFTRILVRDAYLYLGEDMEYDPEKFLEIKYENTIDRMKGAAKNPRPIERVVPDTFFSYEVGFRILEESDYKLIGTLVSAMQMLEADTLGGSGSRGCGKIGFENLSMTWKKGEETRTETDIENTEKLKELIVKEF